MELIACNQFSRLRNTWLFPPWFASGRCRCPLIDGRTSFRVRGAGLAAQQWPAIPALMGFPGHPPVPDHYGVDTLLLRATAQVSRVNGRRGRGW